MSFREGPVGPPDPSKRPAGLPEDPIRKLERAAAAQPRCPGSPPPERGPGEVQVTIAGGKVHRMQHAVLDCPVHGAFNAGELRVITDMDGTLKQWDADRADCVFCKRTGTFTADIRRWLRGEGITLPEPRPGADQPAVAEIREQLEQATTIVSEVLPELDRPEAGHSGDSDIAYAMLVGKVFDALREDQ